MERIVLPYDGEIEILNPGKEAVEACAALVASNAIYAHKRKPFQTASRLSILRHPPYQT